MNKEIWIFNHYATHMFFNKNGRHYWFARKLIDKNYNVTIFTASTNHYSDNDIIIEKGISKIEYIDNIKFVFIKTPKYNSNGFKRILNMILFCFNMFKVVDEIKMKPTIIMASSPHPLTLILGLKIAKKYNISCISEVRDLWPESIVDYGIIKKNNILTKIMYKGEKWIYKNSDKLIFTMEGCKDYIINKNWTIGNKGDINLRNVYYINNGVDLKNFHLKVKSHIYIDEILDDCNLFKITYTGSIRKVNNLSLLLDVAKDIEDRGFKKIVFLVFGNGNEEESLIKRCKHENINNVFFKGRVNSEYIPNILCKSDINILHNSKVGVHIYGASQNKLFEYLAAGKPIINTAHTGYDIVEKYNAGISVSEQNKETIVAAILSIKNMTNENYNLISNNVKTASKNYDFEVLVDKLIEVIKSV